MKLAIYIGNKQTIISGFANYEITSELFTMQFPTSQSYQENLKQIETEVSKHAQSAEIEEIGIAHTGSIKEDGKTILAVSYLHDYADRNVVEDFHTIFPDVGNIYMESVGVCCVIGEALFGQVADYSKIGLVRMSEGIGGAYLRIIGDTYSVIPAEVGHQIVKLNGRICACGQRGCLQTYVGARAIQERFLKAQGEIDDLRLWDDILEYLAIGIANLYTMFYPEVIVLSGPSLEEIAFIKPLLKDRVYTRLAEPEKSKLELKFSDFKNNDAIYGALAMLKIRAGGNGITHII